MPGIIFMIGARAAGKTTIGSLLARKLELDFVDTDVYLQESLALSVAEIVSSEGWPGFRKRESEILLEVSKPGTVVATGGGMVLAEENRAFMRSSGTVLFLSAPPPVLAARLSASPEEGQRPTLTGKSITEEMAEVVSQRAPLYLSTASHTLNAELPIKDVLAQALAYLRPE